MTPTPRDLARLISPAAASPSAAGAQTTGTAQVPPCPDAVPVPAPAGDTTPPSSSSPAGPFLERIFARSYGADRSADEPAQRRARARDELLREAEHLQRSVSLTRGRDRDVDLALEYVDRAVGDLLSAVTTYQRALADVVVPAPRHRGRGRTH
ncbi:hypothetical protein N866_07010 [Actinotalea ferrariae CF5-4]|uniref:Uncharacterized protein n=1 Tax=Actinotalea ferrariae CF5-4 TaxID=948458 RepID=A0A021VXA5_9CELL|nr:hypothetical protein [Actinotalea ferrariae]EYR64655.1 hypothetical protein N866_07010 [Actinotalea ferrariae CF5-4]